MATPPSGTVTFLFTDIENSTQLWEAYPEAMDRSLARHNTLLRQALEAHSGVVFKVIGDAFQAAFALPDQALAAALAAQRALHAEPPSGWGETGRLRVRMGLHAGPAEWTGSDYAVSHTLNRLARVVAAAYSDQILLTAAVAELLHGEWPTDVTLDDLGQHRMRGLSRPERLYQVVTLDLPATFPALKTLDAHPNNLPAQPTEFIGREPELTELHTLLTRPDVRLVTLTGPGGTGKTRLALQVAADLLQEFPDGVYFVNLAPIIDPGLVASTIAQTLNLQEVGQHSALDLLKVALREKRILLLLDNFEQVITGAGVVAELHAACPALKSLVTSREVLHLRGEQDYPVPPLGLPPRTEDGRRKTEDGRGKREDQLRTTDYATYITHYEAVRLFIQRALEIKPDFAVTNDSAPAIAEICHRLDGLPLAIELAAVRVKLFSPQKLLQRLENRLGMLTGGARDLPTRQQTLRGTLDWSYDLLDEAEKTLLRRLAVFKGGRTLEAIEAVCNADGDLADVADGLQSLLDKSLLSQVLFRVRQRQGVADEVRFVMLETIHEYATERLKISGEDERVRRAHASFFRAFAAQARGRLEGPQQVEWVERLEAEHNNLRAALAWLLEYQRVDEALRLACSLAYFWEWRGYLSEGRRWLEAMLTSEGGAQVGLAERAQGYAEASLLAYRQGDFAATEQYAETSLALSDAAGSQASRALALRMLGILSFINGQHASAIARHEASLALYREVGDRRGIEAGLVNLGLAYTFTGDYDRAEQLCEEAVAVALAGGDDRIAAQMRFFLGLAIFSRGEGERAAPVLMATLAKLNEAGDRWWIAQTLDLLAAVAAEQGEAARAARLLSAASAVREALGSTLIAFVAMQERSVAAASAPLGPTFATLWAEGQAMTLEQAIAYALSDR